MKLSALILFCFFSFSAFAQTTISDDVEVYAHDESVAETNIKIKEVKALLTELGPENTCLDEYLKRRRNLIIRLSLAPVTIVGGTYLTAVGLGFAGVGVATVLGLDELSGVVIGLFVGFVGGAGGTLADSTLVGVQLLEIDRLTKAIAEQHLDRAGKNSGKIYAQYVKKNTDPLSEEDFEQALLAADKSGKLCDGSMVKKPKLGSGRALRYKVARVKNLRAHL